MKSVRITVRGRVQGVAFRYVTSRRAQELGVLGWVRNRADGSVEAHVQGEPSAVEALLDFARQGPPLAHVESVDVEEVVPDPDYFSFEIR